MNQHNAMPDFDMLVSLHQQDAEAFEAFRKHLLEQAISSAPPSRRANLEKVLNQIEVARAAARTPLEAATIAFDMMIEALHQLNHSWQQASFAMSRFQADVLIERVRQ